MRKIILIVLIGLFLPTAYVLASDPPENAPTGDRTGERIDWQVIASGGTDASSAGYAMKGTVGQPAVGSGASAAYKIKSGYWTAIDAGGGCCVLRGDFNNDGSVKVSDLTALINFLFRGGPAPSCTEHGDTNADGSIKVSDLTLLINFLFRGGAAPAPC